MLQLFRKFFQSGIGVAVTLGFVGLIALAFAGADISGSGSFGGVAGGDRVASVGSDRISTADLSKGATAGVERARQDDPKLTMKSFLAQGGLDIVLNDMIDRAAILGFGRANGIVAGKRLIDSELTKIPGIQGLDGKFSEASYRQLLAQQHLTDADVRSDIERGLTMRQVLAPAELGATAPVALAQRYASLLKERRSGLIAPLPAAAFAPKAQPTPAQIAAWYAAHSADYRVPERRVIRWATFDDAALKNLAAPSDAAIAARYQTNKALYAAAENRRLTQLILPTQGAAQAILAEVKQGHSLDQAARAKGLSSAALGPIGKAALADQSSAAVADAAFAAPRGALVGPVKGALGWHLLRVEAVESKPARSLDAARAEIAGQIAAENRKKALADLTARIDEEFSKGGALSDAAKEVGATLAQTAPLTADGKPFGQAGAAAPKDLVPKDLTKVIQTAFTMERENQPQIAEIEAGKRFVIFDVTQITTAAPAPLAQVRAQVAAAILLEQGAGAAKAAALKVMGNVRKGASLSAAIDALQLPLPHPAPVQASREQIAALGGRVPPAIGLMFTMAQGTVKLMAAPNNAGWILVQLQTIQPGQVAPSDPILAQMAPEMGKLAAREYTEQLRRAVRADVGVKRNETAIRAVASQLVGGN